MDLIKKHWITHKIERIDTRFLDDVNDELSVYFVDGIGYVDDSYTASELCNSGLAERRQILKKVAKRWQCDLVGDELRSQDLTNLLQAMLIVFAYVETRKW